MAPLASNAILDLLRRSAKATPDALASVSALAKRTSLSPLKIYESLSRRDDSSDNNSKYNPGGGAAPASAFNNNLLLIMFAVIGGIMALAVLWFFLMAKNGGFVWREGDWDDYKSTVLRRKGPDGKTLSNATKSTKLGGGSIVPKWHQRWSGKSDGSDYYDKYTDVSTSSPAKSIISNSTHDSDVELAESPRHSRTPNRHSHQQHTRNHSRLQNEVRDPEFDAYRSEKPAAVGGLNKPAEGSHWDYSNTDRSELSSQPHRGKLSRKERKERDKREKEVRSKQKRDARNQSTPTRGPAQHGTTNGSNSRQSQPHGVPFPSPSAKERNSYYSNYRPTGPTLRAVAPEEQRSNSHRAQHRRSIPNLPGSYADDDDFGDDVDHSYTGTEETGTKSYRHHIPGLPERSEVGVDDSVSRVGINPRHNTGRGGGFRRGY